jgi:glycosyltransferase involved in cell wall biosynthesis
MSAPLLSVIIPTHNRKNALRRTLGSLARQTFSPEAYEVLVVDDGSTDGTQVVADEQYLFDLKYLRRAGGGATLARNAGARASRGQVLVFVDDDITVSADTLAVLYETCLCRPRAVIIGTLVIPAEVQATIFARLNADPLTRPGPVTADSEVHFIWCQTGLLAVRRQEFFDLGMFRDPTGGWPNWDDVEFGYRAYWAGLQFWQSTRAVGEHWDYSLADLAASCLRWQRASQSAVRLLQQYPGLRSHISMFHDKAPIAWRRDPPSLIARKLIRQLASSRPAVGLLERISRWLERRFPSPLLLRPLYRWIMGGYIFWGFRLGIQEHGGCPLS